MTAFLTVPTMFKRFFLLAAISFSFISPAFSADAPRIVATPAVAAPVVPIGEPTKLDAGKFLWLDVANLPAGVSGSVTWDFSTNGVVSLLPDERKAGEIYWGGWKQGDERPAWSKMPKNAAPAFGDSLKIDSGKFTWVELPDVSNVMIGGIRQGESAPKFQSPISKTAVPLLGVSKGSVTVSAWALSGDLAKPETLRPKKLAEITILVDGAIDQGKGEDKKVDPAPQPTAKDVYIVVVRVATNLTPAQANLIGDVDFWNSFKTGKSDWSVVNPTDDAAVKNGYAAEAAKKQSHGENFKPVLIVLSLDGKVLSCDLLGSKADVSNVISKVRK